MPREANKNIHLSPKKKFSKQLQELSFCMEFNELIHGEKYEFSQIGNQLFLISSSKNEFILYKKNTWTCAEDVPEELLENFGAAIEKRIG